jgi:hypothetical protein
LEVTSVERDFEDGAVGGEHVWGGFIECGDFGDKVQVLVGAGVERTGAMEVGIAEQSTLMTLLQ